MNMRISTAVFAFVVYGLTIALYALVLKDLYHQGAWMIDMVTLILAETALVSGFAGMIGYGTLSTQAIARWSVVRQFGVVLAVLTVLHTVICIVVPVNVEVGYWIVVGLAVIVFSGRIYFVHTGGLIQEQVEARQQTLHANRQTVANVLHVPTMALITAIQGTTAQYERKSAAADAVRAVSMMIDSLSLKKVENNPSLVYEIGNWADRLVQMKALLTDGDHAQTLDLIAVEAREKSEIITSLYMQ
ncbi:MAG: hypothetical protein NC212_04745 [Staphylococcus sp.]|nr:hypothetical protein [Staphylococcus sp.]